MGRFSLRHETALKLLAVLTILIAAMAIVSPPAHAQSDNVARGMAAKALSQSASAQSPTGVTAGSYTSPTLTINTFGKITAASNGASAVPATPQGRLTLISGTPVMTTDQVGKSTIYDDCYLGKLNPYFDGTADRSDTISGCEVSTTMQASGTGVTNSGGVFDIAWDAVNHNICVVTNGSGGGWASDTAGSNTARGTGYSAVHNIRGYYTFTNTTAHCYNGATDYGSAAADRRSYLGTLYTTAAGQTGVQFTATGAAGGSNAFVGLSNAYNRVQIASRSVDTTTEQAQSTGWVATNVLQRISFVDGLGMSTNSANFICPAWTQNTTTSITVGVALDSTSSAPAAGIFMQGFVAGASGVSLNAPAQVPPVVGLHFLQTVFTTGSATNWGQCGSGNILLATLAM